MELLGRCRGGRLRAILIAVLHQVRQPFIRLCGYD